MPTIGDNERIWQQDYDWASGGDEWSQVWGGEDMQWHGVILPRIQAFITDRDGASVAGTILEIAPGFGRWTKYLKNLATKLILVDLAPKCIEACKRRFSAVSHIEYHVNDGKSLAMLGDACVDFVFSMDSLVHAEEDVIDAYLGQMPRILRRNGVGFIHHSNFGDYLDREGVTDHGRGRSMTARRFKDLAEKAGLRCLSQELINWGTTELIDTLSVFVNAESDWTASYRQLRNEHFMSDAASWGTLSALYGKQSVNRPPSE